MDKGTIVSMAEGMDQFQMAREHDPGPVDPSTAKSRAERYADIVNAVAPFLSPSEDRLHKLQTPKLPVRPHSEHAPAVFLQLFMGNSSGPDKVYAIWSYGHPRDRQNPFYDSDSHMYEEMFSGEWTSKQSEGMGHVGVNLNRVEQSVAAYIEIAQSLPPEEAARLGLPIPAQQA